MELDGSCSEQGAGNGAKSPLQDHSKGTHLSPHLLLGEMEACVGLAFSG